MTDDFRAEGVNADAAFSMTLHRGEGMLLVAMDWRLGGEPPRDFVGFAIEYRLDGADVFTNVHASKAFPGRKPRAATIEAPIQLFRWVVFPYQDFVEGRYEFRVTAMHMDDRQTLRRGDAQTATLQLGTATYPDVNITFTRGFVLSQAFVNRYQDQGPIDTILPGDSVDPLAFVGTHSLRDDAYHWMGFEARSAITEVLDDAIDDEAARVCFIGYDLSLPEIVDRLVRLGDRARVIIDDSRKKKRDGTVTGHGAVDSPESLVAQRLPNVRREHLGDLQHNKMIVVQSPGPAGHKVICGSTNFSWRGFYVQNNNAVVLSGEGVAQQFRDAFERYWDDPTHFRSSGSAERVKLEVSGVHAEVAFSPHSSANAQLAAIAEDIASAQSTVLYSLAFLSQTGGDVTKAIAEVTRNENVLVYGIADQDAAGQLEVNINGPNPLPVSPIPMGSNLPSPFREEPKRSNVGNYMHHKFVVIDFDTPDARVYLGSYNFSNPADVSNGENLLLFKDKRIATAYAIEALRIFDHYAARATPERQQSGTKPLALPPEDAAEDPWWYDWFHGDRTKQFDRVRFGAA
jgi:PLD-like domain